MHLPTVKSRSFPVQLVLTGIVLAIVWPANIPRLAALAATLLVAHTCWVGWRRRAFQWEILVAWGCTCLLCHRLVFASDSGFELGTSFAVLGISFALACILASSHLPDAYLRSQWRILGVFWIFLIAVICLAFGYINNWKGHFYVGLLLNLAFLVLIKSLFRLPAWLTQVVNTLVLLVIGLPLADVVIRPSYDLSKRPDARKRLYAYEEASKNPVAFGHWWYYFVREWRKTQKDICLPATNSDVPFALKPGSDGTMFESKIHINQLGFRGPEIPFEKGDVYRIVALGESTTFGHTLYADDIPWPRLLEGLVITNLAPQRPVQVINAGIPSYHLRHNVQRLRSQILALKPDMIISYHGYNGFEWLMPSLPAVSAKAPPDYQERPLKLLADCEYRLRIMAYVHELSALPAHTNSAPITLMDNEYARCYRELINIAHTNNIRLVLANFSLAANAQSDLDVLTFYRSIFPEIQAQIRANEMHTKIIDAFIQQNPDITFVDTHPHFDGQYKKFIDLVHFTQEGRNEMARTMFTAIRPVLENDLSRKPNAVSSNSPQ